MEKRKSHCDSALTLLSSFKVIIWDFDGVIKDSVSVKGTIFADIFPNATSRIRQRILEHHQRNGGLSRFKKIPLYMRWCGIPETRENIEEFLALFSSQSIEKVINSPWIEGAERYLKSRAKIQRSYLVSATPIDELKYIIKKLGIEDCFLGVFGAPSPKKEAILRILDQEGINSSGAIFIGDSQVDYESATACGVQFIFRGEASIKTPSIHTLSNFL